jgi:hypothetical protein
MKQHTETISESIFTRFPSSQSGKYRPGLLVTTLKKRIFSYREQLRSGAAGLAIGTVFLLTAYLFLTQLAEHGWQ